jgi:omptin
MRVVLILAAVALTTGVNAAQAQNVTLASGLVDEPPTLAWRNETLSFALGAGWLTGQSHEFVYDGGDKISELIWDLNHAYVLNADLAVRIMPALRLNMRGSLGGHIDAYMEDYDWLGLDYGVTDWTHRSWHDDTELDHFARFDLGLQYDFLQNDILALGLLLGARFTGIQWSAYGGSYIYTSDPETEFRDLEGTISDDLLAITYQQNWAVPYLGIAAAIDTGKLRISGSLIGSALAYGSDDDDHWLRSLHFFDDFDRTNYVGASAEFSYRYGNHYQVFLAASAERFFHTHGDTTLTDLLSGASAYYAGDTSGGDHENLQVSVGLRVAN